MFHNDNQNSFEKTDTENKSWSGTDIVACMVLHMHPVKNVPTFVNVSSIILSSVLG